MHRIVRHRRHVEHLATTPPPNPWWLAAIAVALAWLAAIGVLRLVFPGDPLLRRPNLGMATLVGAGAIYGWELVRNPNQRKP